MAIMFLAFLLMQTSAFAMTFVDAEKVMSVGFDRGDMCVKGDESVTVTDLDGTELVFIVHDEGNWKTNYVTLTSADGETEYCSFPLGARFSVKEIHADFPDRVFWLARTGIGVSDDTCKSLCLIGRYGDTYVSYVTLDDLRDAGLVGHEVWWKVEEGELVVTGWKRSRSEDMWRHNKKWDAQLDEVRLFWDDEAQWFGIRHNSPVIYETDNWFYTDENGTNYYLRLIDQARAWIGGQVIREYVDGETESLLYRIEDAPQFPYTIYQGDSFAHPDEVEEQGFLYDGGEVNLSAVALFEGYLSQELSKVVARRRAAEERHRNS